MKRRKTFVIMCVFFISCIALLLFLPFKKGNSAGSYFTWVSGNPKDSVVPVTTGKTVVVPFEFRVGDDISEMSFEIKDESLRAKGVFFEDTVVPVRNGRVSSKVIFKFQPEDGIKAGRYALTIIARDTATGKIIQEGDVPFTVDMLDLIWKCSC
jgi:hypothetical protein